MTTDPETQVRAALRHAADHLAPPPLDLDAIRRGGRQRRKRTRTALGRGAIVLAAVAATGGAGLLLSTAHLDTSSEPKPIGADTSFLPKPPGADTAPARQDVVRYFYEEYAIVSRLMSSDPAGRVDGLIRSRAARWYVPIAEASPASGDGPPWCGFRGDARQLDFKLAALEGSQAVLAARWRGSARQTHDIVVALTADSGKITGITCTTTGNQVTKAEAINAAASLYTTYTAARSAGTSMRGALAQLLASGPTSTSTYLREVQNATARGPLGYDPMLCAFRGLPPVSVTSATIIAGGSAGVVVVRPRHGAPILAIVTIGAKGPNVADIACPRPGPG